MKLIISIALFVSTFFNAFDVTDDVVAAIKSGKSSELVKFFDEKLSVKILNQEDLLSKSQAEANIKFFFEGQEEIGSTNLPDIMIKYKEKLYADLWLIADGPRHQSHQAAGVF